MYLKIFDMGLDMMLGKHDNEGNYIELGYWRKANHIHNWFVVNCQDGIDECQETEISKQKLEDLLKVCNEIISAADRLLPDIVRSTLYEETLPTVSGFFFGGTEYDEYYLQDVRTTIKILNNVLAETDFENEKVYYQSSW